MNHKKTHTADDLARYAEYEPARAAVRPAACRRGERCWVRRGPPSWVKAPGHVSGCCVECHDIPPQRAQPVILPGDAVVVLRGHRRGQVGRAHKWVYATHLVVRFADGFKRYRAGSVRAVAIPEGVKF